MAAIASLRLIDYRSYASLDAEFSSGAVAIHGPNGAGKTNLLEAISLLSPGRGLRRAKTHMLARTQDGETAPAWGVNATLHVEAEDEDEATRISIGQVPEQARRRILRMDGRNVTGAELAKRLSLLWLIPAQDRLFTGPASDRRKFIDRFALAMTQIMAQMRYDLKKHGQSATVFYLTVLWTAFGMRRLKLIWPIMVPRLRRYEF